MKTNCATQPFDRLATCDPYEYAQGGFLFCVETVWRFDADVVFPCEICIHDIRIYCSCALANETNERRIWQHRQSKQEVTTNAPTSREQCIDAPIEAIRNITTWFIFYYLFSIWTVIVADIMCEIQSVDKTTKTEKFDRQSIRASTQCFTGRLKAHLEIGMDSDEWMMKSSGNGRNARWQYSRASLNWDFAEKHADEDLEAYTPMHGIRNEPIIVATQLIDCTSRFCFFFCLFQGAIYSSH